jgi:hypothetical protein
MNSIQVIDNLLDIPTLREIQDLFFSPYLPWYYNNDVIFPDDGHYQFVHLFYDKDTQKSELYFRLNPILDKLNYYSMVRCKSNLLTKTECNIEHGYHIDLVNLEDCHKPKTSIFYVNSNDGYTKFKDGYKVESVENRLITFDSRLEHTGCTCTDENIRIVINFNYF